LAAPGVPAPLADAIDKALQRDPDKRFATAREMREAIAAALVASGIAPASREEIGGMVAELFAAERRVLQEKIREAITASENEQPAALPELNPGGLTPTGAVPAPAQPPRRRISARAATFGAIAATVLLAIGAARLLTPRAVPPPSLRLCGSNTVGA